MRRYQLYESLFLIKSFFMSFYTLIFNFILALSTFERNVYNTILLIIDKFIKRVIDILGKSI